MVLAQINIQIQVYACCNQTCGNMWQYHSIPLNIHIIIHWLHMWFECAVYIHTMRMHHSSNAGMCGALCTPSPPWISTTISGQETLTPRSVWSALQWPGPHSCSFSRFTRFHVIIAWSLHQLHETDISRWQFCLAGIRYGTSTLQRNTSKVSATAEAEIMFEVTCISWSLDGHKKIPRFLGHLSSTSF